MRDTNCLRYWRSQGFSVKGGVDHAEADVRKRRPVPNTEQSAVPTPASASPVELVPLASRSQRTRHVAAWASRKHPDRLYLTCMMHRLTRVTLTDGGRQQPGVRMKTGYVPGLLPEALQRRGSPAQNRLSQNTLLSRRTHHPKRQFVHRQSTHILEEKHTKFDLEENIWMFCSVAAWIWINLNKQKYIIRGSGSNCTPCNKYKQYWPEY